MPNPKTLWLLLIAMFAATTSVQGALITIRCVSVSPDGSPQGGATGPTTIGGRYSVFNTDSPNIVPGDTNNVSDVFLRDSLTGQTVLISTGTDGQQGNY